MVPVIRDTINLALRPPVLYLLKLEPAEKHTFSTLSACYMDRMSSTRKEFFNIASTQIRHKNKEQCLIDYGCPRRAHQLGSHTKTIPFIQRFGAHPGRD